MVNVYTPNLPTERIDLWDQLKMIVNQYDDCYVCIISNFNAVKVPGERTCRENSALSSDVVALDGFIRNLNLLDIPLIGRKFSWYSPDGNSKRRIDQILVNKNWITV